MQKCYPHPLILKSMKKIRQIDKKNYFEKTNRATGLKSWSFLPITIPHNRLDLWYDSIQTFFKMIFFYQSILAISSSTSDIFALYK